MNGDNEHNSKDWFSAQEEIIEMFKNIFVFHILTKYFRGLDPVLAKTSVGPLGIGKWEVHLLSLGHCDHHGHTDDDHDRFMVIVIITIVHRHTDDDFGGFMIIAIIQFDGDN